MAEKNLMEMTAKDLTPKQLERMIRATAVAAVEGIKSNSARIAALEARIKALEDGAEVKPDNAKKIFGQPFAGGE